MVWPPSPVGPTSDRTPGWASPSQPAGRAIGTATVVPGPMWDGKRIPRILLGTSAERPTAAGGIIAFGRVATIDACSVSLDDEPVPGPHRHRPLMVVEVRDAGVVDDLGAGVGAAA